MIETRNKKGKLIAVTLTEREQYELALRNNTRLRYLKEKEEADAQTARRLEEILFASGQDKVPKEGET